MDEFCAEMGEYVREEINRVFGVPPRFWAKDARASVETALDVVDTLSEMGVRVEEGTGTRVVAVVHIRKGSQC